MTQAIAAIFQSNPFYFHLSTRLKRYAQVRNWALTTETGKRGLLLVLCTLLFLIETIFRMDFGQQI